MQQVRTDYVLQVRNLLTMYYKLELTIYYRLELTMYYYCLLYDKLWGPSQRVVTLFSSYFSFDTCLQEFRVNACRAQKIEIIAITTFIITINIICGCWQ